MTLSELFDLDPQPMSAEERQLMEATRNVWADRRREFIRELKKANRGPKIMTRIVVKKDQ